MRKHAGSWIIKILLGAIALAFALSWGVSSYYSRQQVAVKVNKEPISTGQLQEELSNLTEESRRQFGPQYDRIAPLLNLKERAMSRLVDRTLLFQAARDMGVLVSDQEVRRRLTAIPNFQVGGKFDFKRYQRTLAQNRMTPEAFETSMRGQITLEKVTSLVAGAAAVSPLEVDQALSDSLSKVQGVYLLIGNDSQLKQVKAGDEELSAYYDTHKRDYLVPEKVRFSYLVFPLANYRDLVQVSDEDLADAYERDRARYVHPEAVRVSHILVRLSDPAGPTEEATAKKRAEEILEQSKQSKQPFLDLAKQAGPGLESGDLGFIQRGQTVGPFEEAVFALEAGQVGLVRSPFGWHVVKVEERRQAKITPLEEVRGELRARMVEQLARERTEVAAERAFDEANHGAKMEDLATKYKLSLINSPEVSADQPIPGLAGVKGLFEAFDGLGPGQAAPVFSFEQGSVLAMLQERIPEQVRPLAEVKEDVRLAVLAAKAQELARQEAQKLVDGLAAEKDPAAALAKKPGAKKSGWLGEEDGIEGLASSAELVKALYMRPLGRPLVPQPIPTDRGYLVAVLGGKQPPSDQAREEKRSETAQQLLTLRQRQLQESFIADLRAKADIKVLSKL
ncbi:MAG: SurA N-terminal domain-containing protein [Pseudomonadota bacterium]